MKTVVILHNIRSAYNVGSIFRTADAAGVMRVVLSGYTPAPRDKFNRKSSAIAKAALGAEESVEWQKYKTLNEAVKELRGEGFKIVAVEQDKKSINYKKLKKGGDNAFVLGNEVKGLSKKDLELCDEIVEIEMRGEKESLNVSVAAGVILFS